MLKKYSTYEALYLEKSRKRKEEIDIELPENIKKETIEEKTLKRIIQKPMTLVFRNIPEEVEKLL